MPVPDVARRLVVEEPFLEDVGAALPGDVGAATGEEAGDGMATEVVDPAGVAELAH